MYMAIHISTISCSVIAIEEGCGAADRRSRSNVSATLLLEGMILLLEGTIPWHL